MRILYSVITVNVNLLLIYQEEPKHLLYPQTLGPRQSLDTICCHLAPDTDWKPLIFNSAPAANGFCITKSPRNLGCVKITLLCVLGSGWMLTPHFIVGVLLTELRLRPQQLLVMTLLRSEVYIPPARKIVSFPDPNPRPRLPAAVMVWDTGARSPGPFCTAKQRQRSLSTSTFLPLTSFPLQ